MGKKVALHNLGCKVNAYEVEAMQQLWKKRATRSYLLNRALMYI